MNGFFYLQKIMQNTNTISSFYNPKGVLITGLVMGVYGFLIGKDKKRIHNPWSLRYKILNTILLSGTTLSFYNLFNMNEFFLQKFAVWVLVSTGSMLLGEKIGTMSTEKQVYSIIRYH